MKVGPPGWDQLVSLLVKMPECSFSLCYTTERPPEDMVEKQHLQTRKWVYTRNQIYQYYDLGLAAPEL